MRVPNNKTYTFTMTEEAWFYKHIRHPIHEDDIDKQDQYWRDVTHWMPLPLAPEEV